MDVRIYRAAFLPALLALILVMFSFESRPAPLTSTLAPDAFDAVGAFGNLTDLANRYPDRRPGSNGDASLAGAIASRFRSLGLETSTDRFTGKVDGSSTSMTNVAGVLSGQRDRQVVVLAHRDASSRPGASSAASTAMLLALASALSDAHHTRTIVFVSTDGGTANSAGTRRFAEHYPDRGKIDGILVLEDVAAAHSKRPYVVPWSTGGERAPLQLARTADAAVARESGANAGSESSFGQFLRQAWPLTLREQGPLVEHGLHAITLTARGELPLRPQADTLARVSRERLLEFGKAALSTVLAVDAAPAIASSPRTFLVSGRRLVPGWTIGLLALALLAPAVAAAVDAFARARRRKLPVGRWARWALAAGLPFLATLAATSVFRFAGWLPDSASDALSPASRPSFAESAPPLAGLAAVFILAWLFLRPVAIGRTRGLGRPEGPEVAVAIAFVLSLELVLLWMINPLATLLIVPAAHLCLLSCLPEVPRRSLLVGGTIGAALLFPLLVCLYYGARLGLGLDPTRYALLLLAGGNSFFQAIAGSLVAGALVSTVSMALARKGSKNRTDITVRGPRTYAGPGSLGGTQSALRR